MTKLISISESKLIRLIEDEIENHYMEPELYDVEDEIELEPEDSYGDELLTPEEIVGLMEDQIVQLQGRVDYSEELLADVLEFTSALMSDLTKSEDLNLRKSRQKLRNLETRAGREIFWLKSRRLS
jgi:hypothetical protein|tara:strand:+ start:1777 stop:2154 length:378 start_codon:yes stop_codon:yes gene_type:complete